MNNTQAKLIPALVAQNTEYARLVHDIMQGRHTADRKSTEMPFLVNGLAGGASGAVISTLVRDFSGNGFPPVLLIVSDERRVGSTLTGLGRLGLAARAFPARDLNFYNITASHDFEHERLSVLSEILSGDCRAVVTTPDAALSFTVPRRVLENSRFTLSEGDFVAPESIVSSLVSGGYSRVELVEGPGQFALRGGILDVYPSDGIPFRAEFFGDELDRLGALDVITQRVSENIRTASFIPAREVVPDGTAVERLKKVISERLRKVSDGAAADTLRGELSTLENLPDGGEIPFADKYESLIYPERECLLDYIGPGGLVISMDSSAIEERITASAWHISNDIENMLTEGILDSRYAEYCYDSSRLDAFRVSSLSLVADTFRRAAPGERLSGIYTFSTKQTVSYADKLQLLREELAGYMRGGWRTIILCDGEAGAEAVFNALNEESFPVLRGEYTPETLPFGTILVSSGEGDGFELVSSKLAVLSVSRDAEGARNHRTIRESKKKKKSASEKILSYAELTEGDYVVHTAYGIGRYDGIENLTVAGVSRDYIKISYAGSDRLFLPVDQLENVSKYIGAHSDDGLLKLSKMGGAEWKGASSRAKAATKQMAAELIKLYAERRRTKGFAFPPDDDLCREFDEAFPYDETDGQLVAEREIKADMEAEYPMDRLLCGDVGYGKTEVALRAAMKCILSGKQVVLLVPTTILAFQHYTTAQSRMQPFSVKIDMLSRFRTPGEQATTIRKVRRGDVDLLIGTHRLLSQDIEYHDLGLLIVDEEQRFGVAQKEKIKQIAKNVDVLSLSATPIPRTLNMAMSGIRDMSLLDEAPGERLPVQTYVLEHDDIIIGEAIRRELRRGGQVFYLYNRVESITSCAARVRHAVPDARIAVAHGKMDREQLEDIWQSLVDGEIDILISTTIIETGVDVPNANTLIIENADRLGLAQLHQIRGRVGRSHRRAYAYFTYPKGKTLSEIATKRLSAIREYTEFGAGFKIALRDLEIRGAGNILGAEQHGHMDAVGYDLYIKLLNDAILEEKGEIPKKRLECKVDLPFDAYLSDSYVPSSAQRMEMYKKIAAIRTEEDCDDICDELCDRFGELPREAFNLCRISLVRALGEAGGFTSVSMRDGAVALVPAELKPQVWLELHGNIPKLKVVMLPSPRVTFKPASEKKAVADILDLLLAYIEKTSETPTDKEVE